MSTTSPFLKLVLQDLDENPDTWGTVLNVSGLECLEDAISGTASITLTSTADYTLNDDTGGPTAADGARYQILNIGGTPGGATNVIVPTRSKTYLAANATTDSSSVVVKTAAGSGVTLAAGDAFWVYCNGTDIVAVSVALAKDSTTATTATNSTQLAGVAAASYSQLATANTWTAGQVTQAVNLTVSASVLTPDCSLSNAFYHLTTETFTLNAPTSATVGQRFSLLIQQAAAGGPHTISFQSGVYQFADAVTPVLSTAANAVDYLAFEYYAAAGGNRWVGSIIKNIGDV